MTAKSTEPFIRLAQVTDAAAMLDIYAPFVRETPVSFETEVPSVETFQIRIQKILERWPWLVYEVDGQILGYAYASLYRSRLAYQWSVETTVYVADAARKKGVGRSLYERLADILRRQGYYRAFAGIVQPNPTSVLFHERLGFELIGIYRNVGYKHGAWHDVGWWSWTLQSPQPEPSAPRLLSEITPL